MNFNSKPLYRGTSHKYAFFISLISGSALISFTSTRMEAFYVGVYVISVSTLFGVSALYHRVNWPSKQRRWMRRIDHSSIYFLISGTYTPVIGCTLEADKKIKMLALVWGISLLGIAIELLPKRLPKWVSAIIYIGLGWLSVLIIPQIADKAGVEAVVGLILGGAFYTVGAIFYASRKPRLYPQYFGYHEVFHLFVIAGVIAHFVTIARYII